MPMNKELLKVALRQHAIYLPQKKDSTPSNGSATACTAGTMTLVYEMRQLGFAFSEDLL